MKLLVWMGSSLKDLKKLPSTIVETIMEIRVNGPAGTYRSMYTTRIGSKIYVLHAFPKKSTQGVATQKRDLDLIRKRLKDARALAKAEGS